MPKVPAPKPEDAAAATAAREADLNAAAQKLAGHTRATVNQMAKDEKLSAATRASMLASMSEVHRRVSLTLARESLQATMKAAGGET